MNVYTVKLTRQTEEQMREIAWYITVELNNPDAADSLMEKLGTMLEKIGTDPEKYPPVDKEPWKSEGVRWIKVGHYIVYFWIDIENAAVQITGMVYEKRDQIAFLNEMQFSD